MADKLNKEDIKFRDQIAARLREIREAADMNQTVLSHELGVDPLSVSRYETGGGASIYVVRSYCKVFGVSVKNFF
ncbi:helix-turn-helix domain-containing protein [Paraflavitalea pollutisoli]|uniref:helix-turn-helix domain-containing protein n=1 Tax=Paraflavitalea pollutisoli TaxID=3034143 RepID=UPI0023EAE1EE|nr:helix-turn-helix transcriptional regulator [Paraflavitalea sp. H1-2-19X]